MGAVNGKVPLEEQDRELREKLLGERDGILRWAEEGCAEYLRDGLHLPPLMEKDMWKHRAGAASLEDLIEEGCYVLASHRFNVTWPYQAY